MTTTINVTNNTTNQDSLIINNTKLIHSYLHKIGVYSDNYLYNDLYSCGLIGLVEATKDYSSDKAAFSTHAFFKIRKQIQKGISNQSDTISYKSMPTKQAQDTTLSLDIVMVNTGKNKDTNFYNYIYTKDLQPDEQDYAYEKIRKDFINEITDNNEDELYLLMWATNGLPTRKINNFSKIKEILKVRYPTLKFAQTSTIKNAGYIKHYIVNKFYIPKSKKLMQNKPIYKELNIFTK